MAEKRKLKTPTAIRKAPTKRVAPARKQSVQTESPVPIMGAGGIASAWSIWSFMGAMDECPPYWSRARDKWLREFVYRPGNDLLAGVMATAVNKVTATGFVLEGPERTVNLYRDIILRKSEFGAGYAKMIGKDAFDFFSQDAGAYRERIRTSPTDTNGGALGFAHFDSQRCFLTGQSEFPVEYVDVAGAVHKLHFSQVQQYTDLPSPQETLYGIGFCSVSRAITTAHILVDIARYKRERLSDLPPAGILLLNNLEKSKWQDMEKQYSADERNKNNTVWRNVMVAFGMDPAVPATAELFEFSRLPEHFNEPEAIRIAVLSLALAFNMDVNEIWSILGGQMGSGRESDVQHMKAKGKGPGAFLTETERGWNDGLSLPPGIVFQYDFADAEEDQLAAQIADTKAATIRKLWEPSSATGAGIITTDEARQWLQLEGLVTDELMAQGAMADESIADDVEMAKSMIRVDDSPHCKAYSDGRVVRLECKAMSWLGVSLPAAKKVNVEKFNPYHEPAGNPTGGQFTEGDGGGIGGDSTSKLFSDKRNPDDIRSESIKSLSSESGIPERVVKGITSAWLTTSNDDDFDSLEIQKAATRVFETSELSAWQKDKISNFVSLPDEEHIFSNNDKRAETFLKTSYDMTQRQLSAAGIKEVTVYRGVRLSPEDISSNGFKDGVNKGVSIRGNALESWTADRDVAEGFARATSGNQRGVVISSKFPINRVVGTGMNGFGGFHVKELVITGGNGHDKVDLELMLPMSVME